MAGKPDRKVFHVAEITRLIKSALENEIGEVWVEGEVSNLRQPSSGHCYFTLKDETAQIRAVLFRGNRAGMRFQLKDGLLVRVLGDVTVYERSGDYQIIVRQMEEGGKGALQAKFEALKEKLLKEGLFDESRKKPIPMLPQHVGIVTSPTGAAIKDILKVISRRFPNLHVVIAPVKVQGEGSAEEIAGAINLLNEIGGFDVLIVGRGGGSLEDLWAFNEEIVARAIAASGIPVISAVGHEIDFTISDFVADLRAPTPSVAAEMLVGRKDAFEEQLGEMQRNLVRAMKESILRARHSLRSAAGSYVFREPRNLVRQYLQRLDNIAMRMKHELEGGLGVGRQRLDDIGSKMLHQMSFKGKSWRMEIRRFDTQLKALSPLAVLRRGYSVTSDATGKIVRRSRDLKVGQRLTIRVEQGTFESEVKTKNDNT
jgi:exodeoxyribonuclease VII large subunit